MTDNRSNISSERIRKTHSVEKERLSSTFLIPNWVRAEHHARYKFASGFTSGKVVIDCACGNGEGTKLFADNARQVYAFDIAEEALAEARAKCPNTNVQFSLNSATDLPVSNDFADVYISLETIEHIDADGQYLLEAVRVLKKGGIFICSTPNRIVTNPGKTISHKPANVFHVREYGEGEFSALLSKYFSKVDLYGQNSNSKLKVSLLASLGRILPMHLAVRLHQANKLAAHKFRKKSYYEIQEKPNGFAFEYLTAVCIK